MILSSELAVVAEAATRRGYTKQSAEDLPNLKAPLRSELPSQHADLYFNALM